MRCLTTQSIATHHNDVSLRSWSTEETRGVKEETDRSSEGSSVVSKEVDVGVLGSELLLPGLSGEGVVYGNDVDVLDTLASELLGVLDVAWNVVAAWWSESAWNTDDEV